jgi:PPM family protein phosphatase
LRNAVRQANDALFSAAKSRAEFSEMQTTMTAAVLSSGRMAVAHVGDCRLYRLRDGQMRVLTRDHTTATPLLPIQSSRRAGDNSGKHRLTRSLGSQPFVRVDLLETELIDHDVFLLCSDGLWGSIPEDDIRSALAYASQPEAACRELLGLTLKMGAPDNLSAVVFAIAASGSAPRRRRSWGLFSPPAAGGGKPKGA